MYTYEGLSEKVLQMCGKLAYQFDVSMNNCNIYRIKPKNVLHY